MKPNRTLKLFHTGRHLKFSQILFRGYYSLFGLQESFFRGKSFRTRPWRRQWASPMAGALSVSPDFVATFLNVSRKTEAPEDWHVGAPSRLWLYNLHYLDTLNAPGSDNHADFLQSWVYRWHHANPSLKGCGWEPYPLSLRIVNLVKWYARYPDFLTPELQGSLSVQAEVLRRRLEYQILGNHLFANAKALVFAGAFFEGARADALLKKGLSLLDTQIQEQFLADGAHFELSPMYHATLLWDVCDLIHLTHVTRLPSLQKRLEGWRRVAGKAAVWMRAMLHPDGGIAFFNDAAFGVAPTASDLETYLAQLEIPVQGDHRKWTFLQSSGYGVVEVDAHSKAILDLAKVGPRYQPGHAHADTLSFELSLYGSRFLVNTGTSGYCEGERRQYERSTAAHNTVTVDDADSSEVWAGFRVARRAYPRNRKIHESGGEIRVSASHTGYRRLPGRNIHTRTWRFSEGRLILQDVIQGRHQQAISRLYFHPDVTVQASGSGAFDCTLPGGQRVTITVQGHTHARLTPSTWSPEFGLQVENRCLEVTFSGGVLETVVAWGG